MLSATFVISRKGRKEKIRKVRKDICSGITPGE